MTNSVEYTLQIFRLVICVFQNGKADLNNIDPEFTREPVPQSVARSNGSVSMSTSVADNEFKGFSYVPQSVQSDIY